MAQPNEFTDYDRRSFEHAAKEETGSADARVVEVNDDDSLVKVVVDDGIVTMRSDEYGFPYVAKKGDSDD